MSLVPQNLVPQSISQGMMYNFVVRDEGTPITTRSILRTPVPLDILVTGVQVVALNENCVPTLDFAINIRDNLSQEYIFHTEGNQAQGSTVPAALVLGQIDGPHIWPVPRPFYQNSQVEVVIDPGEDIHHFTLVFLGERMDRIRDRDRIARLCADPRTSGYAALVFDAIDLSLGSDPTIDCPRGPIARTRVHIETLPYDFLITSISAITVDPNDEYIPLVGAHAEMLLTDLTTKSETSTDFVPVSFYGGQTHSTQLDQSVSSRKVSQSIGTSWMIPQQSALELAARSIVSPDPINIPQIRLRVALHGMRVPSNEIPIGYPYRDRLDGSLRCPPKNLPGGIYTNNSPGGYPSSMPYPGPRGSVVNHPSNNPNSASGPIVIRNPSGAAYRPGFPGSPSYTNNNPIYPNRNGG